MSYLHKYLNGTQINKILTQAGDLLEDKKFDTIAVRGMSGMLIGAPLAAYLDKSLILVRKEKEQTHSTSWVENWGRKQRILLVDDFIESGETIDAMCEKIQEHCDSPKIVGIFLYACTKDFINDTHYTPPDCKKLPLWSLPRYY